MSPRRGLRDGGGDEHRDQRREKAQEWQRNGQERMARVTAGIRSGPSDGDAGNRRGDDVSAPREKAGRLQHDHRSPLLRAARRREHRGRGRRPSHCPERPLSSAATKQSRPRDSHSRMHRSTAPRYIPAEAYAPGLPRRGAEIPPPHPTTVASSGHPARARSPEPAGPTGSAAERRPAASARTGKAATPAVSERGRESPVVLHHRVASSSSTSRTEIPVHVGAFSRRSEFPGTGESVTDSPESTVRHHPCAQQQVSRYSFPLFSGEPFSTPVSAHQIRSKRSASSAGRGPRSMRTPRRYW